MAKGMQINGVKQTLKKLNDLGKKAVAINRRAVNLATTPILQAARDDVPVEEGDLRKSLVKVVRNQGMEAQGIVGADRSYMSQGGERISKDERHPDAEVKIPSKYDHLVEYGFVAPDGTQVPARPFLRTAWDESIGTAQQRYQSTLVSGIEKAATA